MAKIVAPPEQVDEVLKDFNITPEQMKPSAVEEKVAAAPAEEVVPLTDDEAKELYEEAAAIESAIERLVERKEQIKAAYRRLDYGTKTVHAEAQGKVIIGHNPIFNEARFLVEYPYDFSRVEDTVVEGSNGRKRIVPQTVFPNRPLYKITADRPAMKRILSEEDYKALFDEGDKKVTIK